MRNIVAVVATLAGLFAGGVAGPSSALAKKHAKSAPAPSGNRCVQMAQAANPDQRELVFTLQNKCKDRLECKVAWEVTCDAGAEPQQRSALVDAGAREDFHASASECPGDWRISPARWTCRTPSAGDTASR